MTTQKFYPTYQIEDCRRRTIGLTTMNNLDALIKRLAQIAGLSEEDAGAVLDTAVGYIKAQRPDKADKVDEALANEKTVKRIGDLVGKLADKVKPEEQTLPRPYGPQADHHQPDGEPGDE